MSIKKNEFLPNAKLFEYKDQKIVSFDIRNRTKEKKIILFAVPGAFNPTCSEKHFPGFLSNVDIFLKKGFNEIWCLAINDPFVMYAWGLVMKNSGKIKMISDGNAEFTKKVGLHKDLGFIGLGLRSNRYSMIINDSKVTDIFVEDDPGTLEKSDADSLLKLI